LQLQQQARAGSLQVSAASHNRAKSQMPQKPTQIAIDYKAEMRQQAIEDYEREVGEELHTKA